ncbi:FimV/HubP family polar landmark protein [SAR92 clade bacterium H246]
MTIRTWSIKLAAGSALAALLYTSAAIAVGFGEIALKSALNEPLNAEIELTNVDDIDDSMLLVKLASPQAFTQAGVSRDFYLTALDFEVGKNAAGATIVRVTTEQPVVEPYLDFLVQLEWPSGRLVREYTLLLDLPVYSEGQVAPAPVSKAVSGSAPKAAAGKQTLSGDQHRVVVGDTLWNVSKRLRPRGLTILQTMDALYSQNPSAFVNGDANRMQEGAILRLPSKTEIGEEAGDIVASQIGLVAPAAEELATQEPAIEELVSDQQAEELFAEDELFPESDSSADQQESGGVLELITAYDASEATELAIAGDGLEFEEGLFPEGPSEDADTAVAAEVDQVDQLNSELVVTQDEMSKTQLENNELRERMALLEAQVDTMETLVDVAEEQEAAVPPVAKASPVEDFQAQLKEQPWYLWLGLGVIILVLVMVLRRTSKTSPDDSEQLDESAAGAGYQEYDNGTSVDTGANLLVDELDGLELDPEDNLFDETDKEIFAEEDADVSPEIFDSMVEATAEAEVYLSLGNIDQAIEILQKARAADAADTASRLKLMEVLFREGRRDELKPIFLEVELTGDEVATSMASVILGPEEQKPSEESEPESESESESESEPSTNQEASEEQEPSASLNEEPEPEPEPSTNQEASEEQEPSASLNEDPEPESEPSTDQEASEEQEPSASLNEEPEPSASLNEEPDDKIVDELAESVLDEDFLDDSFMDGGIFADVSPADKADPLDDEPETEESAASSFAAVEPVQQTEDIDLPGVDALQKSMGAEADALADIAANLDQFEGLEDVGEINSVDVKLDLAATYIEMGDAEGAREILSEIIEEADDEDRARAQAVLDSIGN